MPDTSRPRPAVRVLMLDEDDDVLLLRGERPDLGRSFWFTPGGGLEEGEDARATAAREVAEEVGLADLPLGPEIWHRRHRFSWRGIEWDQSERWFLARVQRFEPDTSAMSETEKREISGCRWWTQRELESTGEELAPHDLARRIRVLLDEGPPDAPLDISAQPGEGP
jgi:8-oxo-dGTP pyrophosphatase MutT (NUDIX family)